MRPRAALDPALLSILRFLCCLLFRICSAQTCKPLELLGDSRRQLRLLELRRQNAPGIRFYLKVPAVGVLMSGSQALSDFVLRRTQAAKLPEVNRHMKMHSPLTARIDRLGI